MATLTERAHESVVTWRDRRRYAYVLGLSVPLLPFGAKNLVDATGLEVFWYFGPLSIVVLMPLVDTLVGTNGENPPDWAFDQLTQDRYYRVLTYLFAPLQYVGFFWSMWMVATAELSLFARIGLTLTAGAVGGIGIANAHELGHKKERIERRLAKVVLAQTGYGHFVVEHNRGHHARVATPEDPASARLGESFWTFLPRSVIGAARSGWRLESARLRHKGRSPFRLDNDVLNAWLLTVALFTAMTAVLGVGVLPFLVLQAVYGCSLLEVVNYLEHYGLLRQKDDSGRYERCRPRHSWNSDHIVSNIVLYGLERHSDHHANPTRRYQTLRTFDEAPQLPSGYGLMIALAYVTPLWRRVMDPRVLALYDGDATKANLSPRLARRHCGRDNHVVADLTVGQLEAPSAGDTVGTVGTGAQAVRPSGPPPIRAR